MIEPCQKPFWEPGRFVSLWDLMQQFDAATLVAHLASLSAWWSSVRTLEPPPLSAGPVYALETDQFEALKRSADKLCVVLERVDLATSLHIARALASELDMPSDIEPPAGATTGVFMSLRRVGRLRDLAGRLCETLPVELQTRVALVLPSSSVAHFDPAPFGQDVANGFPDLRYDVSEAAKCLALRRATASAFHSIRCLEGGITAMSRCLAIPDPTKGHERSWFKLLGKLKAEIDRRWPDRSVRQTPDSRLFEEAYTALAAMQNPYRNATMHLEKKYTMEEAEEVFDTVRGFIRRLARRMDQDGSPLA